MPSNMVLPKQQNTHSRSSSIASIASLSFPSPGIGYGSPTLPTHTLTRPSLTKTDGEGNSRPWSYLKSVTRRWKSSRVMVGLLVMAGMIVWVYSRYPIASGYEGIWDRQDTNSQDETNDNEPSSAKNGILVGSKGSFHGVQGFSKLPRRWPGYTSELFSTLIDNLRPVPSKKSYSEEEEPLSELGRKADDSYVQGETNFENYKEGLYTFLNEYFPKELRETLGKELELYLQPINPNLSSSSSSSSSTPDPFFHLPSLNDPSSSSSHHKIYMTDKDKTKFHSSDSVKSWKNSNSDDWEMEFLDDGGMEKFVKGKFGKDKDRGFMAMWNALPSAIHKADTLRYLLLYLSGGIYTDVDTKLLKSLHKWGKDSNLFQSGQSWLSPSSLSLLQSGESSLPPPSVIVGIEADVGSREDWALYWPRPLQIVQWTLGSVKGHPIFLDALQSIARSTGKAVEWDIGRKEMWEELKEDESEEGMEKMRKLEKATVLVEPSEGGPVGVMNWTGPGIWTDAVIRYLRLKYGLKWTDLRGLTKPLRVGEVVILPVTGFSPGVGLFGAGSPWHDQAMVEHQFAGSWKHENKD